MKKWIAAFLAGAVTVTLFNSVLADEAADALSAQGILEGDGSGQLRLEEPVTRAEFAKMLVESLGIETSEPVDFKDIHADDWYYTVICRAAAAGIVNGFEDGTVRPDDPVTYEQAVKMALAAYGEVISGNYPADYLAYALENGYLDQMDTLMEEAVTREDAVQLIYRIQNGKAEREQTEQAVEQALDEARRQEAGQAGMGSNSLSNTHGTVSWGGSSGNSASGGGSGGGSGGSAPASVSEAPALYLPFPGNDEEYRQEEENGFRDPMLSPLSTFSLDVDTASYSNMRRFLIRGQKPASGSIRTEELINYFDYDYPQPEGEDPLRIITEVGQCPWNEQNRLAMIAVQGEELSAEERQPSNLVFLIDVSGSMYSANKLPLVQQSMGLLLDQLDERDTVSIVTYASGVRTVLDSVSAGEREKILSAIYGLRAGGGTNGGGGLQMAYELAEKNKIAGNNRIILCTDGDFNLGMTSTDELKDFVSAEKEKGIYLSVLGFGMGNYKDYTMETIADSGNGNYAYIDTLREAKKVLADEVLKTLYTIAEDVKIQVEFNPETVQEYRLIGYENRLLNAEEFDDDTKDAGEVGAGAVVTVFYEIVPADDERESGLRYQQTQTSGSGELMNVRLRYKRPESSESILMEQPVTDQATENSDNFYFAAAVAELGMILNESDHIGQTGLADVIALARTHMGEDPFGFRHEFVQLVDLYRYIQSNQW